MRSFLKAEAFYLKKDMALKTIGFMIFGASIVLVLWMRSVSGEWRMNNLLEPLNSIVTISIFLYFIIPVHACFFSTEGFEYGTIKNIISSGKSRSTYFLGKFLTEIQVIIGCLVLFYGVYVLIYYFGALFSGAEIGNNGLEQQMQKTLPAVLYNILYLTAYMAIVLMIGIIVRKTALATILSFAFIFGDLMMSSYWKESSNQLLHFISENAFMTQILKFSGMYVVNSELVLLSGTGDHIRAVLVPLGVIIVCLSITLFVFNKRDI